MKNAYIIVGLGFGDEGKGATTDYLVRAYNASLVVRFNGGCQAAHNVVTPEHLHHTFAQFGSGTLAGAATHLSKYMLVEPLSLLNEAKELQRKGFNPIPKLSINPSAVVTTPFHWLANQIKENYRKGQRHGSVGRGIGETRADQLSGIYLTVGDMLTPSVCIDRLAQIRGRKAEELRATTGVSDYFDDINIFDLAQKYLQFAQSIRLERSAVILKEHDAVVFEGAQGVLLDENLGVEPHRTWTNCTFENAESIIHSYKPITQPNVHRIGVLRTYHTRHGAGPFPTEDSRVRFPEEHNETHPFMGAFRQGYFDVELAKYAINSVGGIDILALNHIDQQKYSIRCRVEGGLWDGVGSRYVTASGPLDLVSHYLGLGINARTIYGAGPSWKDRVENCWEKEKCS